jgi:hypothetical protein
MWLVGALIAACGTMVYIELGTVCFCFIALGLAYILYQGTSSEWRCEELPRIHLPSSQIHGDVYIYRLYPHNGKRSVYILFLLQYSFISDRETRHQIVSFSANVHILISLILVREFILCPRSASFFIYRANMAQYATCCLYHSDFDMPCPWYLFETGSPFAEHSWRYKTRCTCPNSCFWPFISCWCKRHPNWG